MLTIRQEQMAAFEQATAKRFQTEMFEHSKQIASPLCAIAGDDNTHMAVQRAIAQASAYGFSLRGPVRLYVELTFLLGSGFDTDPQYPAFNERLEHKGDEMLRAESLFEYVQAYEESVMGHQQAALSAFTALAARPIVSNISNIQQYIQQELISLYPQKVAYTGNVGIETLIHNSLQQAISYGLNTPASQIIFTRLCFFFGHACTQDPLHPWIQQTLSQASHNPTATANILQVQALNTMKQLATGADQGVA